MKTIWAVRYNDGTADVFDEDQGPPSWPYVDAFEAKQRIAELEAVVKKYLTTSPSDGRAFAQVLWRSALVEVSIEAGRKLLAAHNADRAADKQRIEELEARAEKAEANYQFMVDRAADEKLDGYRELGQRAADAENERDELKRHVAELEEQNLNMMALFRDFYELEFNRDECWDIIKKYGGDA